MYSVKLQNCHHCFGCSNLVNKSYCVYNQQKTKEEYTDFLKSLDLWSHIVRQELAKKFSQEVVPGAYFAATSSINSSGCIGDGFVNSNNCFLWFDMKVTEDCRYTHDTTTPNDTCFDAVYVVKWSRTYNTFSSVSTNAYCSRFVWECSDVYYCDSCMNSQHLFACVWLQNKSYCVLNKQYSKDDYFAMVQQIVERMVADGSWWRFPEMSCYGYNESVAAEFFPLKKEEAVKRGFTWQDKEYPVNLPEGAATVPTSDLPDHIDDIDEGISKKALICWETHKPFRVVAMELAFYRRNKIPLPRVHHDVRYHAHKRYISHRDLYLRTCDKTWEQVLSVYPADASFKVYSQEAYRQEMFG